MTQFNNFINGRWIPAISGETFENRNPANQKDKIGDFALSGTDDLDAAVNAASEAFKFWKQVPAPRRGDMLRKAGDIFTRRKDELARIMTREMGKPIFETRGDIQEAIDTAYYAASETRRLFGYNTPSELPNKMNLSFRVPVGVCGIITAWNFPIAVPSWKILPALACGNTVIFKPSSEAPHSGVIFAEILEEAGIPAGGFNLLLGRGEIGEHMAHHPGVHLIAFTGSTKVGKKLGGICGELNKKVSLEMGGKNPQIVMPDADIAMAIEGVLWGAFGTTGQRCTATSRLILHKDIYDAFLNQLVEKVKNLRVGPGLDAETEMGPVIRSAQIETIDRYVEIAIREGARLLCGGQRVVDGKLAAGNFYKPTILADVKPDHRIFQEEIFGPVLAVSKAESFEHSISLANDCRYGLSSSIYTADAAQAFSAMRDIEAGITYINAPTIGAEAHMPFGGIKGTGNGYREGGWTVFDIFTEWKTVYVDYSGRLQKAQIDTMK
jgi:alpha-ketoglutaric semialdehyde dehydrogenase